MLIECETCAMRDIACSDCVVGVLLSSPPMPERVAGTERSGETAGPGDAGRSGSAADAGHAAVVGLTDDERAALAVLAGDGLVPPLRLVRPVDSP
ncbi:MAG: hypothetical protein ACR2F6_18810 [Mycobacteriales bacterium]